jgi:hypothetical protein
MPSENLNEHKKRLEKIQQELEKDDESSVSIIGKNTNNESVSTDDLSVASSHESEEDNVNFIDKELENFKSFLYNNLPKDTLRPVQDTGNTAKDLNDLYKSDLTNLGVFLNVRIRELLKLQQHTVSYKNIIQINDIIARYTALKQIITQYADLQDISNPRLVRNPRPLLNGILELITSPDISTDKKQFNKALSKLKEQFLGSANNQQTALKREKFHIRQPDVEQKNLSTLDKFDVIQSPGQEFSFGKEEEDKLAETLLELGHKIKSDRSNNQGAIQEIIKTIQSTVLGLIILHNKERDAGKQNAASKIQSTYIYYARLNSQVIYKICNIILPLFQK